MDKIFKALADKNRRIILTLLKEKGPMSVNEILEHFDITQATLSSHLSVLRKADLVMVNTKGKQRIYEINMRLIEIFVSHIKKFGTESVFSDNKEIIPRKKSS